MGLIAIIGGSGLTRLKNLEITRREVIRTPYGEPSAPMVFGALGGTASGTGAVVTGGRANTASGSYSSVTGGLANEASGTESSVTGGDSNEASAFRATVSGGSNRTAAGQDDWVAGSLFEDN